VVTDSVFSVSGRLAPLAELHLVARAAGAGLLVDEAHALGVVGDCGRGAAAAVGIAGEPDVVLTATLSKALGSAGGVVLGPAAVRQHLVSTARSFVFDTGLAPPSAAAALAALRLVTPERVAALRANAGALADGVGVARTAGAVVPVPVGDARRAADARDRCRADGVRVGCFRPPSVPRRPVVPAADRARRPQRGGRRPRGEGRAGAPVSVLVVTGTGTAVGKTVVTAALASLARSVTVVRPAQTGVGPDEPGDLDDVVRRAGEHVRTVELARYPDPLSPGGGRASLRPAGALPRRGRGRRPRVRHRARAGGGAGGLLVRFSPTG
jgi:hypothetical protein